MTVNSFEKVRSGTEGNILFTGRNTVLIESLIKHIPQNYAIGISPAVDMGLEKSIERFNPHAIVICLTDESQSTVRAYSPLSSNPEYMDIPIFAIGKEDDCNIFKNNIFAKHIEYFKRPFDTDKFHEKLYEVVTKVVEEQGIAAEKAAELDFEDFELDAALGLDTDKLLDVDKHLMEKIRIMTILEGRKTVLVVDDDVTMLNTIKLYLQELYDVVVVPSGTLALKYLAKKKADVVLLDYMMPDLDGPAVLKEIRTNSPSPDIPVVFLTGVSDKDMVMRGIESQPDGYVLKPVSRQMLLEKVTEVALGL